ncbi:MAG: ATP:cob(I)alamin adenosyltransferase [Firmicutes bacterium HGW-Firmicutes-1]|jgi:ATP:cob(I)alamin adenosyltransferase|nr:MAG: ATP:cob(I)alamin adenosyltransferase [Firmicutes bacterium HGW-Firmicutes-1]
MSKIYTKGGDKGETSLYGGSRILKSSKKVGAYGSVDQANAAIGVACVKIKDRVLKDLLKIIQEKLFVVGGELASDEKGIEKLKNQILEADVTFLERVIDELTSKLSEMPCFIVPGASEEAAYLHVARTAVRLAEREIVNLSDEQDVRVYILEFINRLSDLLFVMSRYVVEVKEDEKNNEENTVGISLELANEMAAFSIHKAQELKVPVVISIVDEGGNLILLNRMGNAHIGSIDISINKAYTSMAFKLTTETLGKLALPGEALYGIQNTNGGKVVVFGGGIPIYLKGKLVGAIGISGGSVEEDILIAEAALKNL